MELLPITISAIRGNWQRFISRQQNAKFLEIQAKVFKRDRNTCRYCGFEANKYMVVVNHDQDYSNNKAANLVTACSLCYPCFFIDRLGTGHTIGGGILIYLPEISQADLNHFCRVLFSSMLKDAPYRGKLNTTYLTLKERSKHIDTIFGPDCSKPTAFGQALLDSNLTKEQIQSNALKNVRYLPDKKYLKEQILHWKATVFDQIPL